MDGYGVDVGAFCEDKKRACVLSNEEEFVDAFGALPGSARSRAANVDWSVHCPVVESVAADMPVGTHYTDNGFNALAERVHTLERHTGVVPIDKNLAERVRVLEDKIMRIEQMYPQVAQQVFNYARDTESLDSQAHRGTAQRSSRQAIATGGPLRKRAKSSHTALTADDGGDEDSSKTLSRPSSASHSAAPADSVASEHTDDGHDSSLAEIQRRMEELRRRLQLQTPTSDFSTPMEPIPESVPAEGQSRTDSESDASLKRSPRKHRRNA